MPRGGRDAAADSGLPREMRRLVEPGPSGSTYCFISISPASLAILLAHPKPLTVVESMLASGRISDALAGALTAAIEESRR